MTPNSNYQAKQRRNITTASVKQLNPGTPLTFRPDIFHGINYWKSMKKDDLSVVPSWMSVQSVSFID